MAAFFAALGYRTDSRQPQSVSAMGIIAGALSRQIKHIERIAVHDNGAEPLDLVSDRADLGNRRGYSRDWLAALRNRAGNYLLVLTDDYERLDFVLLQRSLPGYAGVAHGGASGVGTASYPHGQPSELLLKSSFGSCAGSLTPSRTADAQYDKLLSAYAVAEWSEPLFNNRALFSDYYLNERLPELAEWRERPEEAYHSLRELLPRLQAARRNTDEDGATFQPRHGVGSRGIGVQAR